MIFWNLSVFLISCILIFFFNHLYVPEAAEASSLFVRDSRSLKHVVFKILSRFGNHHLSFFFFWFNSCYGVFFLKRAYCGCEGDREREGKWKRRDLV